jgi:hypothetical protein
VLRFLSSQQRTEPSAQFSFSLSSHSRRPAKQQPRPKTLPVLPSRTDPAWLFLVWELVTSHRPVLRSPRRPRQPRQIQTRDTWNHQPTSITRARRIRIKKSELFFLLVTVLSTALLLALHKSTVYSRPAKPSPVKPSNQKNHFSPQFGFNQHSLITNGQRREFVPYHTTSGLLHDTSIIIVVRNTYHHQPVLPTLAAHLGLRFPHPGISLPCIRLLFRWCCHPSVPPVLSKSRF